MEGKADHLLDLADDLTVAVPAGSNYAHTMPQAS
jgi:hypothetical protein